MTNREPSTVSPSSNLVGLKLDDEVGDEQGWSRFETDCNEMEMIDEA